ncbi:MAG: GFA family protein [Caldimonas sp.]
MHIDGSCHCGAISFTAEIDPAKVTACHCTDCQVLSGAPFRSIAMAPIETFSLKGQPRSYVKVAQSGNRRAQVFCPECGSAIYSAAAENPTAVAIRLGCVSQRALLKPVMQTWHHSAMPWLSDLASIPSVPESTAPPRPSMDGQPP